MESRWEWLHRINTAQGLFAAVFGGPAVTAAIHAILVFIPSPSPAWWVYLLITAACSAAIALVLLPSRNKKERSAHEHEVSQTPEARGRLAADTAAMHHWKGMAEGAYEELKYSHESYKQLSESSSAEIGRLKEELKSLRESVANFKIQAITGSLSNIRIKRHGITSGSGGDRKVVCELSIGISLQHSERGPVEIVQMSLTTWPSTDRPVRTLEIRSPLGIPFALEEGRSHAFMFDAQIEFADDGSNTIPPSLNVMVVDKYNGRHFIPLDHGQAVPKLP